MLELYFQPFACSLGARIALAEAKLEAKYIQVDITTKLLVNGNGALPGGKGKVPVLRLPDGSLLTENAAVLQYIADSAPESGIAPPPGDAERYRLQGWLSFVGTEVHKGCIFVMFSQHSTEEMKTHARAALPAVVSIASNKLGSEPYLLGERFSVADAYLVWALLLAKFSGFPLDEPLAAFVARVRGRKAAGGAIAEERKLMGWPA